MARFLRHFFVALQFFTRIPITGRLADWVGFSPAMLRSSAAHFPGVGWVFGGLTAAVFWGLLLALLGKVALLRSAGGLAGGLVLDVAFA